MLTRYNYDSLLCQENSHQDVEFVFCKEMSGNGGDRKRKREESSGEEVEEGRIKAHKLLLSLVSPVFKSQFFGPLAKSTSGSEGITNGVERVVIKGHNLEAFKMMVEFIYSENKQKITASTDLSLLFDLFDLSNKYLLDPIKTIVQETISLVQLSLQDYEIVMTVMLRYSEMTHFEEICSELKTRFSKIGIKEQIENPAVFCNLWINTTDHEKGLLNELMLMLADKKNYCENCKKPTDFCLDGEELTPENCLVGMRVTVLEEQDFTTEARGSIFHNVPAQTQGTVTELYPNETECDFWKCLTPENCQGHVDLDFNLGTTVINEFPDDCITISCTSTE